MPQSSWSKVKVGVKGNTGNLWYFKVRTQCEKQVFFWYAVVCLFVLIYFVYDIQANVQKSPNYALKYVVSISLGSFIQWYHRSVWVFKWILLIFDQQMNDSLA